MDTRSEGKLHIVFFPFPANERVNKVTGLTCRRLPLESLMQLMPSGFSPFVTDSTTSGGGGGGGGVAHR